MGILKRRRDTRPDDRPRWDDPDLKVWRGNKCLSAEQAQQLHRECMTYMPAPHWRDDPTYYHVGKDDLVPPRPVMQICISISGSTSSTSPTYSFPSFTLTTR